MTTIAEASTARPSFPWGWLVIAAIAVASIAISLQSDPEAWINGQWTGTVQVDSTKQTSDELHRSGNIDVRLKTEDSFLNEHKGEGTIAISPGPQSYAFQLYRMKIEEYNRGSNHSLVKAEGGSYALISNGETAWSPPDDPYHLGLSQSYFGTITPDLIRLHTANCLDLVSPDCNSKYRITVDLTPKKSTLPISFPRSPGGSALDLLAHLIFPLPLFIVFYRRRYAPWRGVYFVTIFTLIAGLTFGVSWLVALAASLTDVPDWIRNRARLRPQA